ncbi:hypothetical protein GCM10026983_29100 [Gracilibacillus alcaliphilus]
MNIDGNSDSGYQITFNSDERLEDISIINSNGDKVTIDYILYNPITGNYVVGIAGDSVTIGDELNIVATDADGEVNDDHYVTVPNDPSNGNGGSGNGSGSDSGSGITNGSGSGSDTGSKLPDTATSLWMYGVGGIGALLAGVAARLFGRKKKES